MKEKISTLLDDELDIKSASHTVSEIIKDKRLRERFEAYQLIRDAMKNELSDATLSSQSILDAIDKEPIQIQFNQQKKLSDVIAIRSPDLDVMADRGIIYRGTFCGCYDHDESASYKHIKCG